MDNNFNNLNENIKRSDIEIDENVEVNYLGDLLVASKDDEYITVMMGYTMKVIALGVETGTEGFKSFKKLSKVTKLLSEKLDLSIALVPSPPVTAPFRMTQVAIFNKNLVSLAADRVQVLSDSIYHKLPTCYMVKEDGTTLSDKGAHIMGDLISKELLVPNLLADSQNSIDSANSTPTSNSMPKSCSSHSHSHTDHKPSAPLQPKEQGSSGSTSPISQLHTIKIKNPKCYLR